MSIPYRNPIARCVIVEYDVTRKWYSIKNQHAQVHIINMSQDKYFQFPLRNDQGHRDMKYHRNTKDNVMYIDMY